MNISFHGLRKRVKCRRKNLPETSQSALREIRDSIGIRIICGFVNDIYKIIEVIKAIPGVMVYNEKDYISTAKPNGYRSYHLILQMETNFPDVLGNDKGTCRPRWQILRYGYYPRYPCESRGKVSL